ncbi:cellulase family glycosylhydrolase [Telmatobacter sp. DSM 110680]|uniref:Cellulase family glycosylhydrolase n=1 Tax=Telmatobacter sp. DSM 110680 TaxID=3036704 RepID=A0AAU7DQ92_9BACT
MNGQLSNGLPGLQTSGNKIISLATLEPVTLRGVNRSGLEYAGPDEQGFLSGASLSRSEIQLIVRDWRCNIIRLPFNQDFVLRGRLGRSGEEYQKALDQVIYWASAFGAYTLLDLQWLDAERIYGGNRNFVAPLPNSESVELWTTLARRYASEPAVLYDLFNEPHDRLDDDPYPLNKEDGTTYPPSQRRVTMREWQPWARKLTQAIRSENQDALVFLGGTNWAYDLRGMPMDLENVVYSTHVYPNKSTDWPEAFGNLSKSVPVFAGEFGGTETPGDLEFVQRLIKYLEELEIGWTAWSWSDSPFLVARYAPTAFGRVGRQALSKA